MLHRLPLLSSGADGSEQPGGPVAPGDVAVQVARRAAQEGALQRVAESIGAKGEKGPKNGVFRPFRGVQRAEKSGPDR